MRVGQGVLEFDLDGEGRAGGLDLDVKDEGGQRCCANQVGSNYVFVDLSKTSLKFILNNQSTRR